MYSQKNNLGIVDPYSLGIDSRKCELIRYIVENEGLDSFAENEHFYYWMYKQEKKLSDVYKFVREDSLPFEMDGKTFDLNSFEGVSELIVEKKDVKKIDDIFSGPPVNKKVEFILRYSKKYDRLEYYKNLHTIEKNRNRDKYYIRHDQNKFFSVNDKNHVRIYPNKRMVRYMSNKSVLYYRPSYKNQEDNFCLKINRRLLNLHLGNDLYKSDERFEEENSSVQHLSNKCFRGCSNLDGVLQRITKGRPVPKVLKNKFGIGEVISLYNLVDYDEMDKIIKFLYDYYDFFSINYFSILENYYGIRFGILVPDKSKKQFLLSSTRSDSFEMHPLANGYSHQIGIIRDYIRMSVTLGKKVNMTIRSIKRLIQEHDELVRKITSDKIPKIKVHRSYPKIDSGLDLIVEKIEDKSRLIAESEIQKHCVKTYAQKINKGLCCIYSLYDKEKGSRYTIEVVSVKNKIQKRQIFLLNQMRGKFNTNPNADVFERTTKLLKNAGVFISKEEAIKDGFLFAEETQTNNFHDWVQNMGDDYDDGVQLPF